MRAIKGGFVMRHDGKPASFGRLRLELKSDEPSWLYEPSSLGDAAKELLVPIGDTTTVVNEKHPFGLICVT
jgi:hypothetical protein